MEKHSPKAVASRLRARAGNELLLAKNLNDGDARVASIILNHVADVIEGMDEPVIERPVVKKLAHV